MLEINWFDQYWLTFFRSLPDSYTTLFHLISYLGHFLLLIVPSAIALALGKGNMRAIAAVVIISLLAGNMVMIDLKEITMRLRPEEPRFPDYTAAVNYSFPSSHTFTAFVAASILGGYFGWKIRVAGYALATLVAISRLYLIVHYATDVIAGALIGVFIGEVAILLAYRLGICEKSGFLGKFPLLAKRKRPVAKRAYAERGGFAGSKPYYAIITAVLMVFMAAVYTGYTLAAIVVLLAIPAIVILFNDRQAFLDNSGLAAAFFTVLTGQIVALLAYHFDAYLLSLLIIATTPIALLWLTAGRYSKNENGGAARI